VAAPGRERLSRNAPLVLLAVAMAAAAAVLLAYGSGLTFFQDAWEFLMHRRELSAAALLDPHNEHIVAIPVAISMLSLHAFGMDSILPELVVLVALLLGAAGCLFVYVRRRLGSWPALFMTALLLFLGPAWQDLLWPFQMGFAGAALTGLGGLLLLEEGRRERDPLACVLLVLSILFSSLGLSFAVAAGVEVLLRRRQLGLRRLYVAAVPLLVYAGWYAGWGHTAPNQLSADNVLDSPAYVWEGVTASLDSVLALGTISGEVVGRSQWGAPLLIALLVLVAYGQLRRPGFPRGLWPPLAAAAVFWFLAAFNTIPGREPYSSRYLYVGVFFLLLVAANLLQGVRPNRWAPAVAGALTAVVVGFNLVPLREGRDFFEEQSVLTRADLGAIEIAARTVEPTFTLASPEVAGTVFLGEVEAGEYLQAVREHGSPAYTPTELATAPEAGRRQADLVLANALPLAIETGLPARRSAGRCRKVGGDEEAELPLRPGVTTIHFGPGSSGAVRLRRFARGEYPLSSEDVLAGSTTRLYIPRDRSPRPWLLGLDAAAGSAVCRG
jgi:hypothetical protein